MRATLDLDEVYPVAFDRLPRALWPAEISESDATGDRAREIVELPVRSPLRQLLALPDAELLVPVRVSGEVVRLLAIVPGPARQGLVTHEIDYPRATTPPSRARSVSLQHLRTPVSRAALVT